VKTRVLLVLGVLTLALSPALSAQSQQVAALTDGLSAFTDNAAGSLPFAASAGMDWSNAYLGQLIDTDFPFVHLGVGASAGMTTLPVKAINPLLKAFGKSDLGTLGIPFAAANLRVGGIILPFDVGLKVGFLPDAVGSLVPNYTFTYNNFGIDVRYDLMKSDILLPDISIGGGINSLSASATTTLGDSQVFSAGTHTLTIPAPVASLSLSSFEFEGKAQVSKTLLGLLTPYLGVTALYGTGTVKAGVNSSGMTDSAGDLTFWQPYFGSISTSGLNISKDAGTFGLKVYGGTSLNILILKIDAQGMYNLLSGDLGVSIGARLQL
jgi:hypothetical protein